MDRHNVAYGDTEKGRKRRRSSSSRKSSSQSRSYSSRSCSKSSSRSSRSRSRSSGSRSRSSGSRSIYSSSSSSSGSSGRSRFYRTNLKRFRPHEEVLFVERNHSENPSHNGHPRRYPNERTYERRPRFEENIPRRPHRENYNHKRSPNERSQPRRPYNQNDFRHRRPHQNFDNAEEDYKEFQHPMTPRRNFPNADYDHHRAIPQNVAGPTDYLMSFEEFSSLYDRRASMDSIREKYIQYKEEYVRKYLISFFKYNKNQEWFKTKYSPNAIEAANKSKLERALKRLEVFRILTEEEFLKELVLEENNSKEIKKYMKKACSLLEKMDDQDEMSSELFLEEDKQKWKNKYLFLDALWCWIHRKELEDIMKIHPSFLRLHLSDPDPKQRFARSAWATFRNSANIEAFCERVRETKVRQRQLHCSVGRPLLFNILPAGPEKSNDFQEAQKLAEKFDEDREITRPSNLKDLSLDQTLTYLRIVHNVDFYAGEVYENEDDMPLRLAIWHVRGTSGKNIRKTLPVPLTEDELVTLGKKDLDEEIKKYINHNTTQLDGGLNQCLLCNKKFKGPTYVENHIKNKHPNGLATLEKDIQLFNNYLKDQDRPVLTSNSTATPPLTNSRPIIDYQDLDAPEDFEHL